MFDGRISQHHPEVPKEPHGIDVADTTEWYLRPRDA
jgi:hypothetical protein